MNTTDKFFVEQKEKSCIKTMIVTDFFKAYFPIINNSVGKNSSEILYIDLFCGPGCYQTGEPSTPLKLLDIVNAFSSDDIRQKLKIVLNDENHDFAEQLQQFVDAHPVTKRLRYRPTITSKRASQVDIFSYIEKRVPIFSFIDPWGYVDVSAEQTWALIKNVGSDCVLFFNSNRIIMDMPKEGQHDHLRQLFGDYLSDVQAVVIDGSIGQKEKAQRIVEIFAKNLSYVMYQSGLNNHNLFVLPFCFEADEKDAISHHILFITKCHKAIQEMKRVMLKHNNEPANLLGYDNKDRLQVFLFGRQSFVEPIVLGMIKERFREDPSLLQHTWNIASLLGRLDIINMQKQNIVTPYSLDDVCSAVISLYQKGFVMPIIDPSKRVNKPITKEREFRFTGDFIK